MGLLNCTPLFDKAHLPAPFAYSPTSVPTFCWFASQPALLSSKPRAPEGVAAVPCLHASNKQERPALLPCLPSGDFASLASAKRRDAPLQVDSLRATCRRPRVGQLVLTDSFGASALVSERAACVAVDILLSLRAFRLQLRSSFCSPTYSCRTYLPYPHSLATQPN
eukprot:6213636-Pleurochrysis_carterae.AAC.2